MSRLSLTRILVRCTEDGDCLLRTGKTHQLTGAPCATEWLDGKDRSVGVRRRAYEEYHGVKLTERDQITTCGNPACLAKEHLERVTVSERNRRAHANMDAATKLRRSKALAEAAQANAGKLTPEEVAHIRESEDGPYVMAKKGAKVHATVLSRIKRGVSYKDYGGNPFAGLGGAS